MRNEDYRNLNAGIIKKGELMAVIRESVLAEEPRRIIRKPEVLRRIGVSDTTLWRMWKKYGLFPAPVQLSRQSRGWFEDEVVAWQEARAAERLQPRPIS